MQRQHAKISDALTVTFLSALFSGFLPEEPLFNCSLFVFRSRWNAAFRHLGVSASDRPAGVTPKCLRGSGATWMYQADGRHSPHTMAWQMATTSHLRVLPSGRSWTASSGRFGREPSLPDLRAGQRFVFTAVEFLSSLAVVGVA